MKLGEASATLLSQHNSMAILMNAALGDGKGKGKGPPPTVHDSDVRDLAAGHGDVKSAVAAINRAMTI